jgi:hypothetical protein
VKGRNGKKKKRGKEVEEKAREREMQKKGNEEKEWYESTDGRSDSRVSGTKATVIYINWYHIVCV